MDYMKHKTLTTLGASLLVAGTSIGAGMLGLPVITGPVGFFPSLVVLFLCWAFMAATGFLFAELAVWMKGEVNILTMAKKTLGEKGRWFAWVLYLFLFYSLLVAYLVGGSGLLADLLPIKASVTSMVVLFTVVYVTTISLGRKIVDPLNRVCLGILIAAYFGFVAIGASWIKKSLLLEQNWNLAWTALPIAFTSFGYQGIIPTLAHWLDYDTRRIRLSILCGTLLTLFVYIVWQGLILGIIPVDGPHGLTEALQQGHNAIHPLQFVTNSELVWTFGRIFAFFAISTSFLGVGTGLVDFWADGLKMDKKVFASKICLLVLAFLPPFLIALFYPNIFLEALNYAGGFGSALLLGALPILMVYAAKWKKDAPLFKSQFLGKKWVLILLLAFVIFEIGCEIVHLITK
jgi:tyrosine-specific transport protein